LPASGHRSEWRCGVSVQRIDFVCGECETQKEIDYFWKKLTAGGKEVQCGWLTDKFGVFLADRAGGDGRIVRGNCRAIERVMKANVEDGEARHCRLKKAYKGKA